MRRLSLKPLLFTVCCSFTLSLFGCGGGGGGGEETIIPEPKVEPSTDNQAPSASVSFPPPRSITQSPQITIRGTASDNEEVASVNISGMPAETESNYSQWSLTLNLVAGLNTFTVEVTDKAGNTNTENISIEVTQEIPQSKPTAITLNSQNNEAIIVDQSSIAVVNLTTGKRTIFDENIIAPSYSPIDIEIDTGNQKVYFLSTRSGQFYEFDLMSKALRAINEQDSNIVFNEDFVLDISNNRILSPDITAGDVISIDITSGEKTTLFTPSVQNNIGTITGADYHAQTNTLYMTELDWDSEQINLIKLDLNTNNFTRIIEGFGEGTFISDLALDIKNNNAIMTAYSLSSSSVISVSLESGTLTVLSDESITDTKVLTNPKALAIDVENQSLFILDNSTEALVSINMQTGKQVRLINTEHTIPDDVNRLTQPKELVLDKANNRVLVIEEHLGLVAIDLNTGQRTIISDARDAGLGVALVDSPVDLALDSSKNQVLILDKTQRSVLAIDLINGQRSLVYNGNFTGNENLLVSPTAMAFDSESNVVYLADLAAQNLVMVNLNTDEQKLIAKYSDHQSDVSTDIVLDQEQNKLYLFDRFAEKISSIDLSINDVQQVPDPQGYSDIVFDKENNRGFLIKDTEIVVYNLTTAEETTIYNVRGDALVLDKEANRLFVLSTHLGILYYVDLESEQAVIISG